MIIYKAEAKIEGLPEKIRANSSVAYNTQIIPWQSSEKEENVRKKIFSSAANKYGKTESSINDFDLYPTKSILVTTNWNKNDDIFNYIETWAARKTPSHKPTNLEHDEKILVGHITNTWAMDLDGNIIPDDTAVDDLPDTYHIANGAVIYTNWQDEGLQKRTAELIESIEQGNKYVSMEVLFTNFDYGVITPENDFHAIARNQETAFLSSHLRAYGGSGQFEGCKVGRILKNMVFSGKGYVDKPANPDSIIFDEDSTVFNYSAASNKNPFKKESGVLISCSSIPSNNNTENSLMSDSQADVLKAQNDQLRDDNKALAAKIDELTQAASKANIVGLEERISSLEAELKAAAEERDEAKAKLDAITTERDGIASQLTEITEAKDALAKQVEQAEAEKVTANRVSSLVDGGVDKETAEAKVALYAGLNDEQFTAVAEDIVAAANFGKDKDKDKDMKDKEKKDKSDASESDDETQDNAEANADEEVLENAEASDDVTLNADASNQPSELEQTREELAQAFAAWYGDSEEQAE